MFEIRIVQEFIFPYIHWDLGRVYFAEIRLVFPPFLSRRTERLHQAICFNKIVHNSFSIWKDQRGESTNRNISFSVSVSLCLCGNQIGLPHPFHGRRSSWSALSGPFIHIEISLQLITNSRNIWRRVLCWVLINFSPSNVFWKLLLLKRYYQNSLMMIFGHTTWGWGGGGGGGGGAIQDIRVWFD